nr:immunoglobulin heavy chain junction region [Homo sapiens]
NEQPENRGHGRV